MKKNIIISFILFSSFTDLNAQDSCQCLLNLDHIIQKVTTNYAGFHDKVNSKTEAAYTTLVDSLRKAAGISQSATDCNRVLEKYRLFFYDKHLQIRLFPAPPDTLKQSSQVTSLPVQTKWTKKSVTDNLNKRIGKLNPIEGIWQTDGYEIGVVLNAANKNYEGIVLESANAKWKPGMQKFVSNPAKSPIYKMEYLNGNFVKQAIQVNVFKNFMEMEAYGVWQKKFPLSKDTISKDDFTKNHAEFGDFQFRLLDDSTIYICLKSCDLSLKPLVDKKLAENMALLKKTPDWIVDFRGNQGGATDVFTNLLPYLYTKRLIEKGSNHWMTPGATAEFKKLIEENKTVLDSATLIYLSTLVEFGEKNPGGWFHSKGDTTTYNEVLAYPKRVAVLSDKNNASSGETFLLVARGISDKVTIMGENSAGYLDYGDLLPYTMPCDKLALYIPSRRANYLDAGTSYDRTGYPPDIYIPEGTKDWLKFVYNYWKKHPSAR